MPGYENFFLIKRADLQAGTPMMGVSFDPRSTRLLKGGNIILDDRIYQLADCRAGNESTKFKSFLLFMLTSGGSSVGMQYLMLLPRTPDNVATLIGHLTHDRRRHLQAGSKFHKTFDLTSRISESDDFVPLINYHLDLLKRPADDPEADFDWLEL